MRYCNICWMSASKQLRFISCYNSINWSYCQFVMDFILAIWCIQYVVSTYSENFCYIRTLSLICMFLSIQRWCSDRKFVPSTLLVCYTVAVTTLLNFYSCWSVLLSDKSFCLTQQGIQSMYPKKKKVVWASARPGLSDGRGRIVEVMNLKWKQQDSRSGQRWSPPVPSAYFIQAFAWHICMKEQTEKEPSSHFLPILFLYKFFFVGFLHIVAIWYKKNNTAAASSLPRIWPWVRKLEPSKYMKRKLYHSRWKKMHKIFDKQCCSSWYPVNSRSRTFYSIKYGKDNMEVERDHDLLKLLGQLIMRSIINDDSCVHQNTYRGNGVLGEFDKRNIPHMYWSHCQSSVWRT